MKFGGNGVPVAVFQVFPADFNVDLVVLPQVAQIKGMDEADIFLGNPLFRQQPAAGVDHFLKIAPPQLRVRVIEAGDVALDEIVLQIGHQHPGSAENG